MPFLKTCGFCSKTFESEARNKKFCSRECYRKQCEENKVVLSCLVYFKNCIFCGKIFTAKLKHQVCCSDDCKKQRLKDRQYLYKQGLIKKRKPKKNAFCLYCGKVIAGAKPSLGRKYCSRKCAILGSTGNSYAIIEKIILCESCGKEFKSKDSKPHKFCSRQCMIDFKRNNNPKFSNVYFKECSICGRSFATRIKKQKICSDECRKEFIRIYYNDKYTPQKQVGIIICEFCGKKFSVQQRAAIRKFCSIRCMNKAQRKKREMQEKDLFVENVSINKLITRDGGRCQICGKRINKKAKVPRPNAPTIDHIIPVSFGGEHSYRNTQLACFACNCKKGNGVIDGGEQLRLFG